MRARMYARAIACVHACARARARVCVLAWLHACVLTRLRLCACGRARARACPPPHFGEPNQSSGKLRGRRTSLASSMPCRSTSRSSSRALGAPASSPPPPAPASAATPRAAATSSTLRRRRRFRGLLSFRGSGRRACFILGIELDHRLKGTE